MDHGANAALHVELVSEKDLENVATLREFKMLQNAQEEMRLKSFAATFGHFVTVLIFNALFSINRLLNILC